MAKKAAARLNNVFVVDSYNLSTGTGLLAMHAADMAESGGADRMKQNAAEDWEMLSEEEIFERLLQAEEEQVIVKSRLLEWLRQQAD